MTAVTTRVLLLSPDSKKTRIRKRVHDFRKHGWAVTEAAFGRRGDLPPDDSAQYIHLGVIRHGNYLSRLPKLVTAARRLGRSLAGGPKYDCLYACNLDLLIIGLLVRRHMGNPTICYEVGDIMSIQTGDGPASVALRALERFLLKSVDHLVLTSAGFSNNYYDGSMRGDTPVTVIENKVPDSLPAIPPRDSGPDTGDEAWRIAYLGVIRCHRSLVLLREIAHSLGPRVRVKIAGTLGPNLPPDALHALARDLKNVELLGPYRNPDDLPALYRDVDFAWSFDFSDQGCNSAWLMPNRYYEAGACHVPLLAQDGTEVGARIREEKIGWVFAEPITGESMSKWLRSLSRPAHQLVRERLREIPKERFTGHRQFSELQQRLKSPRAEIP
jgi:succinoglycan biosynthesis protein ExoL